MMLLPSSDRWTGLASLSLSIPLSFWNGNPLSHHTSCQPDWEICYLLLLFLLLLFLLLTVYVSVFIRNSTLLLLFSFSKIRCGRNKVMERSRRRKSSWDQSDSRNLNLSHCRKKVSSEKKRKAKLPNDWLRVDHWSHIQIIAAAAVVLFLPYMRSCW